jgi:uncharacterized caspase-like protein
MRQVIWHILALVGLVLVATPVGAAHTETRIALVIGNADYQQGELPTTVNDAGLIAQTLQAAGFDVVGARDLDGDTLRQALHDFLEKATASGPDTVAMVYLAGYGAQMSGENFFVPVDAALVGDTDLPREAVRISDYVHQLGTLPLRAGIVVFDGARSFPFTPSGQPLAGGLALVEPDSNVLVAFNAAPGTIGSNEPGPYGAYAQALAEMIRYGGVFLPELFDHVRLRVHELTKGAEVPWNTQRIQTRFMFFERGPDAPQGAPLTGMSGIENRPIADFGVRDAYMVALNRDTLRAYEEFLASFPGDPLAKRVKAIVSARREAFTWRGSSRVDTPDAYWSYLGRYPNGPHAGDARRRLGELAAALEPPPTFTAISYDVPPPAPDEVASIARPVAAFGDPVYGFVPPPAPPLFLLPPPDPEFVAWPPPPPISAFVLPVPRFVALPTYVRAPVYVAPPPNNLVFASIHNPSVINAVINRGANNAGAAGAPSTRVAPRAPNVATAPVGPALPPSVAQKVSLLQQKGPKTSPRHATNQKPSVPSETPQASLPDEGHQQPRLPPNEVRPFAGAGGQPGAQPGLAPTPGEPTPSDRPAATTTPNEAPAASLPQPGGPGRTVAPNPPPPEEIQPRSSAPVAVLPAPADAASSGSAKNAAPPLAPFSPPPPPRALSPPPPAPRPSPLRLAPRPLPLPVVARPASRVVTLAPGPR